MLKIGNLNIDKTIVLAPLAGYTDSPFRKIARKHGAGIVFTELISSDGIVRKNKKTHDLIGFSSEERPIGIQIFGKNPDVMGEAARIVEEYKPDIIDINFGCSVRRVVRSGSGAALLDNTQLLRDIAVSVVKNVKIPVSAKIRIGPNEDNKNYMEVVNILEDSGISLITVHGRTRSQAFKGSADWDVIKEIKEKTAIPVIGNGDILSYDEAMVRLKSSGCDAVMIGRGAVGNPWIFSGEKPEWAGIVTQIKDHLRIMIEYYGDKGILIMRKHLVKYIRNMRNSAKLRALLVYATSEKEIIDILDSTVVN